MLANHVKDLENLKIQKKCSKKKKSYTHHDPTTNLKPSRDYNMQNQNIPNKTNLVRPKETDLGQKVLTKSN